MLGAARRLLHRYETFLRIEDAGGPWNVMRARATYMVAWFFALLQGLNLLGMTHSYGGWTFDHTVAALASVIVVVCVGALRWSKNFVLYAGAFIVIATAALLASAIPLGTGVNSALLPFLIVGPVVVAFIQGWRAAVLFFFLSAGILTWLYIITLTRGTEVNSLGPVRDFQRYFQAVLALALCTAVSAMLAANTRQAVETSAREAARAQKAEAAKSAFLATMSHELRTPLNGVIGLAAALHDGAADARQKELSATIKSSGETLLVLLNDILDLSKIEAGKLRIEERRFAPAALAESLAESWRAVAAAKGICLTARIDGALPDALVGDDLRIRQILNNLLSNALKFTGEGHRAEAGGAEEGGGDVTLILSAGADADGGLVLHARVEDSGIGVPPDMAERIFRPFEQGEGGITRRFGGSGLGLSISRLLAERMGGTVELAEKPPPGAAFILSLPAKPADAPAPSAAQAPAERGTLAGLRALAAEDNPVNRMVLSEFLRAEGMEHVIVEDGAACLEALKTARFDVLLLDRHMPVMGGEEVVRRLREGPPPYATMPVVAVTADAMAGERERLLAAGMDDFVSKPLRPVTLREAILRAIAKRQAGIAAAE